MTTLNLSILPTVRLPSREELRVMLARPSVLVSLIVGGTLVVLALIAAVTWLSLAGKGTDALIVGVGGLLTTALIRLSGRVRAQDGKLDTLVAVTPTDPTAGR